MSNVILRAFVTSNLQQRQPEEPSSVKTALSAVLAASPAHNPTTYIDIAVSSLKNTLRTNLKATYTAMSFTLTLRAGLSCKAPQLGIRAFHQTATKNTFFTARTASLAFRASSKSGSSILTRLNATRSRGYQQYAYADPTARKAELTRKLLIGGAVFGGTLVAVNAVFNQEGRTDGGMPLFERSYLNKTFMHTGLGVGIIGLTAYQMIQSGFVYRIMVTNPWIVGLGGLALSIGSMVATRAIDPDK